MFLGKDYDNEGNEITGVAGIVKLIEDDIVTIESKDYEPSKEKGKKGKKVTNTYQARIVEGTSGQGCPKEGEPIFCVIENIDDDNCGDAVSFAYAGVWKRAYAKKDGSIGTQHILVGNCYEASFQKDDGKSFAVSMPEKVWSDEEQDYIPHYRNVFFYNSEYNPNNAEKAKKLVGENGVFAAVSVNNYESFTNKNGETHHSGFGSRITVIAKR